MFINDTKLKPMPRAARRFVSIFMLLFASACFCVFGSNIAKAQTISPDAVSEINAATSEINIVDDGFAGSEASLRLFQQARIYHDGIGVDVDFEQARDLYVQAAALGNTDALLNLGYLYFTGQGVEQDYDRALSYYQKAAKAGDLSARKNIAMMYKLGLGVAQDELAPKPWDSPYRDADRPAKIIDVPNLDIETVKLPQEVSELTSDALPLLDKEQATTPHPISPVSVVTEQIIEMPVTIEAVAPNNPAPTKTYSTWISTSLVFLMLLAALCSAVWFAFKCLDLRNDRLDQNFIHVFFEHHRNSIRGSYLRTPESHRLYETIKDPWAISLCAMMIRFSLEQNKEGLAALPTARRITKALAISPFAARCTVFPFVEAVQKKLVSDVIFAHQHAKTPPKPIQYPIDAPDFPSSKSSDTFQTL